MGHRELALEVSGDWGLCVSLLTVRPGEKIFMRRRRLRLGWFESPPAVFKFGCCRFSHSRGTQYTLTYTHTHLSVYVYDTILYNTV